MLPWLLVTSSLDDLSHALLVAHLGSHSPNAEARLSPAISLFASFWKLRITSVHRSLLAPLRTFAFPCTSSARESLITYSIHDPLGSTPQPKLFQLSRVRIFVPVTAQSPTALQDATDPRNCRWKSAPSVCSMCFISWGLFFPLETLFSPTEYIHFALPLWTLPRTGFGKAQREYPAAPPVTTDSPSCSGGSRWCSDNVGSSLGTGKQSSWRLKSQR